MQEQYEQLTQSKIKDLREEILKKQNFKCAICGKEISNLDGVSLDHQHRISKSQEIGDDGAGLIRGVLCRDCNTYEGKIFNNGIRYKQLRTVQSRLDWLRNLIKYYEQEKYPYIHPTEKVKPKDVSKFNFNKMIKLFKEKYPKRKVPSYPKSKKLTVQLKKLFDEFKIEYYND